MTNANAFLLMNNVLFIIVDAMRADALGVNGNTICRTPNLTTTREE